MRLPRVYKWYEAGNTLYRTGSITCESTALPLWVIDKWLWMADEVVHAVDNLLPHDERGWSAIDRLSPNYGNPVCFAYLYGWGTWYQKHQRQEVYIQTTFEKLSPRTQESLLRMDKEYAE